eukprot:13747-Eustigmatos_ZCMA.PRE.1
MLPQGAVDAPSRIMCVHLSDKPSHEHTSSHPTPIATTGDVLPATPSPARARSANFLQQPTFTGL